MPSIIKSSDRNLDVQQVAFNFDDMAARADQYVDRVRKEAAGIVEEAKRRADEIRKDAEVQGRREGLEAIDKMVEERLAGQLATLMPALKQVVRDIHDAKHAWMTHWEKSAMHVAAAIAQRLIRRELAQRPEITLGLVREALELAAGSARLRIRLNPDDHEALSPQIETLVKELAGLAGAEVVADADVSPGGCRVDTAFGVIDQQFEAQLARIEEELT